MTAGRGLFLTSLVLLFASLAVAERGLHDLRSRALPSDGAQWIWAEGPWEKSPMPAAFLAACDFTLAEAPAAARLSMLGDEEYLLYVNGRLVGSNRYRADSPLDVYEVADLLRGGANRLVAELRSSRGAGGLLAMVEVAGLPAAQCPSGTSWRIFRRRANGVVRGWMPLGGGETPRLWGFSPTGRWGTPVAGEPRPRLDGPRLAGPVPQRSVETLVAPSKDRRARLALYDWGEEVFGFLRLRFARPQPAAVLYFGSERPDPRQRPADAVLVGLPGESLWRSPTPVRLRYLLIGGEVDLRTAEVLPSGPEFAAVYPAPRPLAGILGLSPPASRTPLEEEIRRELHGFLGIASHPSDRARP